MNKFTKKQILIGALILLFVINIAALGTIIYQNYQSKRTTPPFPVERPDWSERNKDRNDWTERRRSEGAWPDNKRTRPGMGRQEFGRGFNRFIKRRLQLDQQQYEQFQLLHRENIQSMQQIARELNQKRDSMMRELTREKPDTDELNRFAIEIGNLHTQLKKNTIDHFTKMKELCRPEQKDELNRMIMEMAQHGRHEAGPRMGPGNRPQNRMNRN